MAGDETARWRRYKEQDRERRVEEHEAKEDERAMQQWPSQQRRRCAMAEVEDESPQAGDGQTAEERLWREKEDEDCDGEKSQQNLFKYGCVELCE